MKPPSIIGFMLSTDAHMIDKSKFLFGKQKVSNWSFFQNNSNLEDEKIEYLWSRDPFYIKQYARIIDESFDTELNLRDVYKKIKESDFRSYYRLICDGNKVVGGFRMIVDDPLTEYSLPSEKPGFTFKSLFPELDLLNNRYTELSRFAVLPQYRNNMMHYVDAFRSTREQMIELGVKYLFLCGSRSRVRIYNKEAKKHFKLIDTRYLDVSDWDGDYSNLEFYVCAYEI